jgi:hypothetical protein
MPRPKSGYFNAAGQPIPGTHDITGRYKEMGGLMNWAYSQGKKGVPLYQRDALDIGTAVHRMAELDLRGIPEREIERVPYETLQASVDIDKAWMAFRQFRDWRKEHEVRAIAFEESLVSEIHQYGGTLDVIALIDGARGLLDFKTSKTAGDIYLDQRLVMAAHGNLWREKHPELPLPGGYHLISLPKDGSKFGHHAFADLSPEWEMFTLQLDCWRIEKGGARKRAVKPATVVPAPKVRLETEAPKPEMPKPRRPARKPKPIAEPAVAAAPVAKAPIPEWAFARPAEQLCMVEIAPPPPVQLSMAELLRSYGHIKEAATC